MTDKHTVYAIRKLIPTEKETIQTIAEWYLSEWETPIEKTTRLLSTLPNNEIIFQLNIYDFDNKVVGTLGLYNSVNIQKEHKQFKDLKPWIGLFYVEPAHRGKGLGARLLEITEAYASDLGVKETYLATFTAESLYKRCGWEEFTRVHYKGHDTSVMKKSTSNE